MEPKKNQTILNLEAQFKALLPDKDAPEELKKEVFETLDTLELLGEITDLFTAKMTKTEITFFDILSTSVEKKNK